jgi:hypothetical protein
MMMMVMVMLMMLPVGRRADRDRLGRRSILVNGSWLHRKGGG